MNNIIKVRWVITIWEKIFLLKDSKSKKYVLPWGKLEFWETLISALKREIIEETWIIPFIGDIVWFSEYKWVIKWKLTLQYLFEIKNSNDFKNVLNENCSHWFEWTDSWFYDLKYLKDNNIIFHEDIEDIYKFIEKNQLYISYIK